MSRHINNKLKDWYMNKYVSKFPSLIALLLVSLLAGCQSTDDQYPDFDLDPQVIERAKYRYHQEQNDFLYLVMVDTQGKVVKTKLLNYNQHKVNRSLLFKVTSRFVYPLEFVPAGKGDPLFRQYTHQFKLDLNYNFD